MKKQTIIISAAIVASFIACTRHTPVTIVAHNEPQLPVTAYNYKDSKLPTGEFVAEFVKNNQTLDFGFNNPKKVNTEVTDEGATLGRVLFYDKKLSLNNTISCGSCHHQDKAFTDGTALSMGYEGRITTRSSMSIGNTVLMNNLFWDSRSKNLEDLALKPIANHIEMGMEDMGKLVNKINATTYYPNLFAKAYGSKTITKEKVANALSQFISSITTADSRFDRSQQVVTSSGNPSNVVPLTSFEQMGHALFQAKCQTCHSSLNMSADDGPSGEYGGGGNGGGNDLQGAANIGLDLVYKDQGVGKGKFRIPSLRNIALTAPYMHDGRFTTLKDVLNFYSHDIKPHAALDSKLRGINSGVKLIQMSDIEQEAIIAFLKTLTDETMVKDPKYSDPFKY